MQDIPPEGPIGAIFFPRIVATLHRQGFEGAVRVTLGEVSKILYFRHGEIASAASNAEADRLASILIREGRLTQPQLDLAKSRAAAGGSLGKTLIELGFLTPAELLHGARVQVRQILASCFTLANGTYRVEPGPLAPEVTVLGLPTRRLIFDALVETGERQWVVREMGSMESVYRPTEALVQELGSLKLEPGHDQVARMLDGAHTLRELSGRTSLDDFTVSKVVLALEVLGMAELAGTPVPESAAPGEAASIPGGVPDGGAAPEEAATPAEEVAEEVPPPPAGELPAFAAPPGEEPQWTVDEKTGERVYEGPVELTFEGRVGRNRARRPALRTLLAASGVVAAAVLAGTLVYVVLRRPSPSSGAAAGTPPVRPLPRSTLAAAPPPAASATPAEPAAPRAAPAPTPEPAAALPAAALPAAPLPAGTAPATAAAEPAAPDVAPPRGSVSPFRRAGRYAAGLGRMDAGDAAGAARIFLELLGGEDAAGFTLQLMIACEEETLRSARSRSGETGSLYIVPFRLKERSCYRACWGLYPTREAALRGAAELPAGFAAAGIHPVIIPVGRLQAASGARP